MSRISDNGLPRSVPTLTDRPASAYNGYIVLVEATGDLYVYTGAGYSKITTTAETGDDEGAGEGGEGDQGGEGGEGDQGGEGGEGDQGGQGGEGGQGDDEGDGTEL